MKRILPVCALALALGATGTASADIDFGLGPTGGYLKVRGADRGTWFGGLMARMRFIDYLGAEASVTYHASYFADGDALVAQIPIQLTGLVYPLPDAPVQPYALAGAGWYYTRIDYRDGLAHLDNETDSQFGVHLGAGAELPFGLASAVYADFRYIFLDEPGVDNSNLDDEEFDAWQITFGVMFGF
jgi:hypothetical protein